MKTYLYNAIATTIKTHLTGIKFIDVFRNQLNRPETNYPFPIPAVIVEIKPIVWANRLGKIQEGETVVAVHLIQDIVTDTYTDAPTKTVTEVDFTLQTDLWTKLQGLRTDEFQPLTRIREMQQWKDTVLITTIEFETVLYEQRIDNVTTVTRPTDVYTLNN